MNHARRPGRAKRIQQRNLSSRITGAIIVVVALSSLVLAGTNPVCYLPHAPIARPVANPGTVRPAGSAVPAEPTPYAAFRPGLLPLLGGMWTAEGPSPTQMGQSKIPPNNEVVGAIKAVAPHPSNASIIYISSVNGGIWETTNGGTKWTAQTDTADSLSGGPIKFDPLDGTHNTLIAGIGNFSSDGFLGGRKSGILLTIDGANWAPPGGNAALTGTNINGVAARGYAVPGGTP